MIKLFWIITLLATLPAAFLVASALTGEASAPQQGALAAVACAMVIIPYVFTRAAEALNVKL